MDGHGDLHLEHIHLTPGTLQIYDCIEFNDRFRRLDLASDIAFLAMDLDFHERPDLATPGHLPVVPPTQEPGPPQLADFYKCYRAFVRGRSRVSTASLPAAHAAERARSARRAREYFSTLHCDTPCPGRAPMVLVVMGPQARKKHRRPGLAGRLGWTSSSDQVRKSSAGVLLHSRTKAATRRRLYSKHAPGPPTKPCGTLRCPRSAAANPSCSMRPLRSLPSVPPCCDCARKQGLTVAVELHASARNLGLASPARPRRKSFRRASRRSAPAAEQILPQRTPTRVSGTRRQLEEPEDTVTDP